MVKDRGQLKSMCPFKGVSHSFPALIVAKSPVKEDCPSSPSPFSSFLFFFFQKFNFNASSPHFENNLHKMHNKYNAYKDGYCQQATSVIYPHLASEKNESS